MKIFHDSQSLTDWINCVNWSDGGFLVAKRLKAKGGKCGQLKGKSAGAHSWRMTGKFTSAVNLIGGWSKTPDLWCDALKEKENPQNRKLR
jgi:hypothetical protein